jgi:hypothetical protein
MFFLKPTPKRCNRSTDGVYAGQVKRSVKIVKESDKLAWRENPVETAYHSFAGQRDRQVYQKSRYRGIVRNILGLST